MLFKAGGCKEKIVLAVLQVPDRKWMMEYSSVQAAIIDSS
jgi:hypothetical protein